MRVLQILGSLTYGGAETMVMNYFRHIDKEKCKMDFIVHGPGNGVYEAEVIKAGAKVIHIPTAGSIGFIRYLILLRKKIIDNGPYDVVHAHTNIQEGMALLAAKMAGVPVRVSHSHNTNFNTGMLKLILNRVLINYASNRKLACGEAAGKAFYGNSEFSVISNAVEIKTLAHMTKKDGEKKRHEFGIAEDLIVLGHVGRFVPQKNHVFLLESFADAVLIRPELRLVCVGDGPLLSEMKQMAKDFAISDKVIFTGNQADMPSIYQMFDIFVLPSKYEGLPLTLVEAQASSLRCLVADNITKECDLGIDGVLYLPLEKKQWDKYFIGAEKTKRIINTELIIMAGEKFDIDVQCNKLLNVYKK